MPMTSWLHRCAWKSMASSAAGVTLTENGCAPCAPLPAAPPVLLIPYHLQPMRHSCQR